MGGKKQADREGGIHKPQGGHWEGRCTAGPEPGDGKATTRLKFYAKGIEIYAADSQWHNID